MSGPVRSASLSFRCRESRAHMARMANMRWRLWGRRSLPGGRGFLAVARLGRSQASWEATATPPAPPPPPPARPRRAHGGSAAGRTPPAYGRRRLAGQGRRSSAGSPRRNGWRRWPRRGPRRRWCGRADPRRRSSSDAVSARASMPGQRAHHAGAEADAVDRLRHGVEHRIEGLEPVGPHVEDELARRWDDISASPALISVGTTLRRSAPSGSWRSAIAIEAWARANNALRPRSGALPECEARPVALTRSVPAALRGRPRPPHRRACSSPASKHRQAS